MVGTQRVCAAWFGTEGVSLTALGAGGFSGSHVFLVRRSTGAEFVLKSFSAGTPPERAAWVHVLMRHLRALDAGPVPEVFPVHDATLAAPAADTLVCDDEGTLWELMQFVRGTPRHTPSADEAGAAFAGLASLHAAAALLPHAGPALERSTGVARRIEQARRILADPWRGLEPAAAGSGLAAVRPLLARAVEILESQPGKRAIDRVAATEPGGLRVQAVLRDVWGEHVLFAADGRLAGFIDFHAAARDTPASDLARLLGSWDSAHASVDTGPTPLTERWRHALAAYEAV
ncbi:MAG: aminoglycoside phosphotransferase family protein, partial [Planctomycetia bacterium]